MRMEDKLVAAFAALAVVGPVESQVQRSAETPIALQSADVQRPGARVELAVDGNVGLFVRGGKDPAPRVGWDEGSKGPHAPPKAIRFGVQIRW